MQLENTSRKAEYSMAIGLIVGAVFGALAGYQLFAEPVAGSLVGAGIGLVFSAVYCGLATN